MSAVAWDATGPEADGRARTRHCQAGARRHSERPRIKSWIKTWVKSRVKSGGKRSRGKGRTSSGSPRRRGALR